MSETIEFQAEARQLLQLMIHSIYSDKDVFLRELVSNASDALDKLRLASYRDKDLAVDDRRTSTSTLVTDAEARTLTVRDNGIGMTREEVVELIGTIAKSGTAEMLARAAAQPSADGAGAAELIGQFGVGFYSSFMVADRVELVTRKAGTAEGVRWESTGEGTYTLDRRPGRPAGHRRSPCTSSPRTPRTRCTTTRTRPRCARIVKRYSDFITWPIRLNPGDGGGLARARQLPQGAVGAPAERGHATRSTPSSTATSATTGRSRWRRSGSPAEGTFEYQALLFLPSHAPMDLFMRERHARRAALRQARVHHGRLRGARPRVPALRQGRRRRGGPVAQRLARDPPAGPADPADPQAAGPQGAVDGQDDAGRTSRRSTRRSGASSGRARQGGPALRPRQPARPSSTSARSRRRTTPDEADHAARPTWRACPRARTRSTTPPATPGRRWRTRRTWRRSGPRATRCCCSPTPSTRCGSTRCSEFDGKPLASVAKGEVDLGRRGGRRPRASTTCCPGWATDAGRRGQGGPAVARG